MISHEQQHKFSHSWSLLTLANWLKYPNEHSSHVKSVDVLNRFVNEKGELVTDRLLQLKQPVPSIVLKIGLPISDTSFFLERSILNPTTQVYEARSYSLSMRSLFQAEEVCIYENDTVEGGTMFTQRASFSFFSLFSKLIEQQAVNRFISNADKGRAGLESVIARIKSEAESFANSAIQFEQKLETEVKTSFKDLEKGCKEGLAEVETRYKAVLDQIESFGSDNYLHQF
jgi:hypothetical protein